MSISVNPSAPRASGVALSMVSKHSAANWGSSKRRAWNKQVHSVSVLHSGKGEKLWPSTTCVNSMKALSAHKCRFKKSTQCFSNAGTAYFLAEMELKIFRMIKRTNAVALKHTCVQGRHDRVWTDLHFVRVQESKQSQERSSLKDKCSVKAKIELGRWCPPTSTSGSSISSSCVARVELNMASKTAEPTDSTNLCAGIRWTWIKICSARC